MELMIASDIHGSALYCEQLIEAYQKEKTEKLLLLGDILYHGPRNDLPSGYAPKKVIKMLNEMREEILCVRGNCEAEVDQMILDFPILAEYCVLQIFSHTIYATHGHVFNEENPLPMKKGDILLNGHTHVPKCTEHETYVYMNPGSVSIPKEESERGYMIFRQEKFIWKTLAGKAYMEYCF